MLQQPLRLGGMALVCALATSALVLVTFLASNLVLSVIGGIGGIDGVTATPAARPAGDAPAAAVLLSAEPRRVDEAGRRCEGSARDTELQRGRDAERCAGQRRSGASHRP